MRGFRPPFTIGENLNTLIDTLVWILNRLFVIDPCSIAQLSFEPASQGHASLVKTRPIQKCDPCFPIILRSLEFRLPSGKGLLQFLGDRVIAAPAGGVGMIGAKCVRSFPVDPTVSTAVIRHDRVAHGKLALRFVIHATPPISQTANQTEARSLPWPRHIAE